MQDIDDINGVAARLLTHAQVLTVGAAPHQQQLAQDLHAIGTFVQTQAVDPTKWVPKAMHQTLRDMRQTVMDDLVAANLKLKTAADELALANTTIESMKDQLTTARQDRDAAQQASTEAQDRLEKLTAQVAALEKKLEAASMGQRQQRSGGVGIASTAGDTHADLKDKIKSDHSHKADPNAGCTIVRDPAHGGHAHKK